MSCSDYWDDIDREAVRLCSDLRTKLAELDAMFDKREREIEASSKSEKRFTNRPHIIDLLRKETH